MTRVYSKHYPIADHEGYGITAEGKVANLITGESVPQTLVNRKMYAILDDGEVPIFKLLATAFIGPIDLPVVPRRCADIYLAKDLTYAVEEIVQITNDNEEEYDTYLFDGFIFKIIPGFTSYVISEEGVVFDIVSMNFVHRTYTPNGYACISLRPDAPASTSNGMVRAVVHRLVYEAYVGPIQEGYIVDHIDNHINHNHYTNLQQITQEKNIHKSLSDGNARNRLKWTTDQIDMMCQMMERGAPCVKIAEEVGTTNDDAFRNLITRLKTGVSYKGIASKYDISSYESDYRFKIGEDDRAVILQMVDEGHNLNAIYKHFGGKYNKQLISHVYKRTGRQPSKKALTEEQVDAILTDVNKGMRTKDVLEKHGISAPTLSIIRAGLYFETRGRGFRLRDVQVQRLAKG
jgi:hypothetical protein